MMIRTNHLRAGPLPAAADSRWKLQRGQHDCAQRVWSTSCRTKPAWPWCYPMNWRTSLSARTWAAVAYNRMCCGRTTYATGFRHDDVEEQSADKKALDLLKEFTLRAEAGFAGLFLRMLVSSAKRCLDC